MHSAIDLEEFQNLPTEDVARLVREAGPKVCVFPINGTRRWFMLEYLDRVGEDFAETYLRIAGQRHIELYRLFFDHGIDTLLTPVFGPDLLEKRGEDYIQIAVRGLLHLAQGSDLLSFYEDYEVRVRIYGDAHRYFRDTPYAQVLDAFDKLTRKTLSHRRHRLFFGICAHDAAETTAEFGARFHQEHGHPPTKRQIVEAYYGEYVEPVDLFIGFDQLAAFDMPLIATGNEDLYFTVSPSPYMDEHTLRAVLYDHLYTRRVDETGYDELPPSVWSQMGEFYRANLGKVIGIGQRRGGVWYPLPQVELPPDFTE
jgi:tuberculosinol/isotuberculosinol synthase